jgi:hypothetical protein
MVFSIFFKPSYKLFKKNPGAIVNYETFSNLFLKIKNEIQKKEKENSLEKNTRFEVELIHSILMSHYFISNFKFKEFLIEIFKSKQLFCKIETLFSFSISSLDRNT